MMDEIVMDVGVGGVDRVYCILSVYHSVYYTTVVE